MELIREIFGPAVKQVCKFTQYLVQKSFIIVQKFYVWKIFPLDVYGIFSDDRLMHAYTRVISKMNFLLVSSYCPMTSLQNLFLLIFQGFFLFLPLYCICYFAFSCQFSLFLTYYFLIMIHFYEFYSFYTFVYLLSSNSYRTLLRYHIAQNLQSFAAFLLGIVERRGLLSNHKAADR